MFYGDPTSKRLSRLLRQVSDRNRTGYTRPPGVWESRPRGFVLPEAKLKKAASHVHNLRSEEFRPPGINPPRVVPEEVAEDRKQASLCSTASISDEVGRAPKLSRLGVGAGRRAAAVIGLVTPTCERVQANASALLGSYGWCIDRYCLLLSSPVGRSVVWQSEPRNGEPDGNRNRLFASPRVMDMDGTKDPRKAGSATDGYFGLSYGRTGSS